MVVIGVMSGTSLDGVDLACVSFSEKGNNYAHEVICCQTIPYDNDWKKKLGSLVNESAEDFSYTNSLYGYYLGKLVADFISKNNLQVDIVASHGHTIFHQPQKKFTVQIGDGAAISAITKLPVVCDFRSADVALGGQGAPLVPVGDKFLFSEFDYCLNLGGIANISFDDANGNRIAFDICPVNMALNYVCNNGGFEFDDGGQNARSGITDVNLLGKLDNLSFYKQPPPKSLGAEWFNSEFKPLLDSSTADLHNKLNTVCCHAAKQIANVVSIANKKMLVTGGGTHNIFLIEKIKQMLPTCNVIIPAKEIIDFKEAIIFAFLGYLRIRKKENVLSSVTGAISNNCSGAVYDVFGELNV